MTAISFDLGNLVEGANEYMAAMQKAKPSFAKTVLTQQVGVDRPEGVSNIPLVKSVVAGDNLELGAFGADPDDIPQEYGSVRYKLGMASGRVGLQEEQVIALSESFDAQAMGLDSIVARINAQIDNRLYARLSDATIQQTAAASTAWNDPSSTPTADLLLANRGIYMVDSVIIGRRTLDDLRIHPEIKEQMANYVSGGDGGIDGVEAWCKSVLGKSVNVYYFDGCHNSKNIKQPYGQKFIAEDLFWIGQLNNVPMFYQDGLTPIHVTPHGYRTDVEGKENIDIQIADEALSLTFTGLR